MSKGGNGSVELPPGFEAGSGLSEHRLGTSLEGSAGDGRA